MFIIYMLECLRGKTPAETSVSSPANIFSCFDLLISTLHSMFSCTKLYKIDELDRIDGSNRLVEIRFQNFIINSICF